MKSALAKLIFLTSLSWWLASFINLPASAQFQPGELEFTVLFSSEEPTVAKVEKIVRQYPALKTGTNVSEGRWFTPLDSALQDCASATSHPCSLSVLEYLIDQGANPAAISPDGQVSILSIFLSYTAWGYGESQNNEWNSNVAGNNVRSSSREARLATLNLLLEKGAEPVGYGFEGQPVLVLAADIGQDFVEPLLAAGADPAESIEYLTRDLEEARAAKAMFEDHSNPGGE